MLLILAWKNVWRNKKRSLIIIAALTFGLWGGLLAGAVMMGWGESMTESAIDRDLGHIQVHNPGYLRDRETTNYIPDGPEVANQIRAIPGVTAVSGRTVVQGMASSPASSFGALIEGVDPANARQVTDIHRLIIDGEYLSEQGKNPVVIGQKLAKRLNLKRSSKIVLSFQAMDSSLVYAAFKVVGIYKSESAQFDESHVFVDQADLIRLLNAPLIYQEIAIRVESARLIPEIRAAIESKYPLLMVDSWRELAPELAYTADIMKTYTYWFVAIILLALLFGITNTMLMAVMERTRELGVLLAIGMKKARVFVMIMLETIMLSLTGGAVGIAIGAATIAYFYHNGINFSAFAESLESFGAGTMLYPFLPIDMYIAMVLMIIIAAIIAAAMPAWKAIHLVPSKAIRTY